MASNRVWVTKRVKISEAAMANMTINPAGMVHRWLIRLMVETEKFASLITRAQTHTHTPGPDLANSYEIEFGRATKSHVTYLLKNTRPYAAPVFLGHGPIKAKPGTLFPVPKRSLGFPVPGKTIPAKSLHLVTFTKSLPAKVGRNFPMQAVDLVFKRRGLL